MKNILIFISFVTFLNAGIFQKLVNYTFDGQYDEKAGEAVFKKQHCATCHGAKGERKTATFPSLQTLSASHIKAALIGYQSDTSYGSVNKFIMQRYAKDLSTAEIDNIVFYIKGHDLYLPNSEESEPTAKTKNNLYIK